MKGKEDGTSRSEPRREPSPFFVSLRVLRALAGGIIVIAVLGLTFSLLPSFSGIPEIPSAGRVLEGTAGLRDGPRWLPEHGDPHALGELSHRLALDLADRVKNGSTFPVPRRGETEAAESKSESEAVEIPEALNGRNEEEASATWNGPPRLIIVIDDMGENTAYARRLLELPYPVVLAVWPGATHARKTAEMGHAAGRQVLVHMPMQPCDPHQKMGAFGLTVDMRESAVALRLRQALARVPHAVGLNNHMGSRFTSNEAAASRFCRELRRQAPDFFVLDSLTPDTSVLYEQARKQGFHAFRRSVFLDDIAEKKAVLRELNRAAAVARKNGLAVAIGHPYPETLAALAVWTEYKRPGLEIGSFPTSGYSLRQVPAVSP